MRILVHRCGSGWGGVYGYFLYDDELKKVVNLDLAFRFTRDKKMLGTEIIRSDFSVFPKESIRDFPCDISLLHLLSGCEIFYTGTTMMDQQIDYVYIIDEDDEIRCVYNTNRLFWPNNEALCGKLRKLLDYGW